MSHAEREHAERPHRPTALWLIITVLIVCISIPLLVLFLTLPELP